MNYDEVRRTIAKNIHNLRIEQGWNQRELATRAGVAQKTVSNLEDPTSHSCQLDKLTLIASAFGLEVWQLMKSDSEKGTAGKQVKITPEIAKFAKMWNSLSAEQREQLKLIMDFNKSKA